MLRYIHRNTNLESTLTELIKKVTHTLNLCTSFINDMTGSKKGSIEVLLFIQIN